MSEQLERMLAGKLYDPSDAELSALRLKAHKLSRQYNNTDETRKSCAQKFSDSLRRTLSRGCFCRGLCILTTAYLRILAKIATQILISPFSTAALSRLATMCSSGRIAACLRLCTLFSVRSAIFAQDLTAAHMIWSTQSRSTSEAIAGLPEMSPYAAV